MSIFEGWDHRTVCATDHSGGILLTSRGNYDSHHVCGKLDCTIEGLQFLGGFAGHVGNEKGRISDETSDKTVLG
jgi:hypothetical protein